MDPSPQRARIDGTRQQAMWCDYELDVSSKQLLHPWPWPVRVRYTVPAPSHAHSGSLSSG